jgi:hypothetical protein
MTEYSTALAQMDLSSFQPLVDSEAKQSNIAIALDAAISRLSIVQDAIDYWNIGQERSGLDTGSDGSAPV